MAVQRSSPRENAMNKRTDIFRPRSPVAPEAPEHPAAAVSAAPSHAVGSEHGAPDQPWRAPALAPARRRQGMDEPVEQLDPRDPETHSRLVTRTPGGGYAIPDAA